MMENTVAVDAFIRMRSEIVSLCLNKIGTDRFRAKSVDISHSVGKCRYRHACIDCFGDDFPQAQLVFAYFAEEEIIFEQIVKLRIFLISRCDIVQKFRLDNAAGAEDRSDFA